METEIIQGYASSSFSYISVEWGSEREITQTEAGQVAAVIFKKGVRNPRRRERHRKRHGKREGEKVKLH